jgi:hypothetical protein
VLDSAPQVPQDYANHFIYGGVLSAIPFVLAHYVLHLPLAESMLYGAAFVTALTAAKKVEDYLVKHETVRMCILKTLVTAALPVAFYGVTFLK